MCDERGEEGTYHTHLYFYSPNPILFSTVQQRFYGAHIEIAKGSHMENREYIRKDGKWSQSEKVGDNFPDTFEESGDIPAERAKGKADNEEIVRLIIGGATNADIIYAVPSAFTKIPHIDATRQTFLADKYRREWRDLHVEYIWGSTGTGKTSYVMNKYGYENVFQVTNYTHPFDNYMGEPVMLFDEFRSSLPLSDMLKYLDGYPLRLPCRYSDKVACYTTVFIISNIPLEAQYPNIQLTEKQSYEAFLRRIHVNYEMMADTTDNPFAGGSADV
ncbi:replication-associated protein [Reptile-associated circular DNA molecule]|nr:replication-associated protein [Reptile-associated circular DNA molecule]